jgi:hypothetical protein
MMLTKDELKAAIVASVAKLGHVPSRAELLKQAGVTPRHIRKHFGTYRSALEACGHERSGSGKKVLMQSLFQDWSEIVRTLKKVPTLVEYEQRSRYSVRPLMRVFSTWTNVPDGMKLYAEGEGLAEEYKDVLDVIEHRTVREYDVPQGVRANVRAEDLEGPARCCMAVRWCLRQQTRPGCCIFLGPCQNGWAFLFCWSRRDFRTARRCAWWQKTGCSQ